jgi:hypothetical protein
MALLAIGSNAAFGDEFTNSSADNPAGIVIPAFAKIVLADIILLYKPTMADVAVISSTNTKLPTI